MRLRQCETISPSVISVSIRKYYFILGIKYSQNNHIESDFNQIFETLYGTHSPNVHVGLVHMQHQILT